MVVKIDLSHIPYNIQHIIVDIVEKIISSQKEHSDRMITLYTEKSVQRIKYMLEEGLRLKDIDDYIISENNLDVTEIAVLKKGDIEQLGIYVCMHCGMAFKSETHRTIHQRMHYF
jgi:hypothetical protein